MLFDFQVPKKNGTQVSNEVVKKTLMPRNTIDIKAKLKNGGEIFLEEPDRTRQIDVSSEFLISKKLPKKQFTNFINKNNVPITTKETLDKIINDISYICSNNEQVDFSKGNTDTLRCVLKEYGVNETLSAENETIFKIDGIHHYEKGNKENPFRIYLKITETGNKETHYKLIFCDIYHLCLISGHKGLNPEQVKERTFQKYYYVCNDHIKSLLDD
ncbi:hypothetical protein [Enterococcus faecalis]|uniref:hypothetical protein n=1 Tax=Enterococcus faecalis TaxID=1351 RepID=UPI002543F69F|nr:hypothetical protein [Enterococcus faecalis]MDK4410675.1 hypothetical protein [Enterococcus faecalis]